MGTDGEPARKIVYYCISDGGGLTQRTSSVAILTKGHNPKGIMIVYAYDEHFKLLHYNIETRHHAVWRLNFWIYSVFEKFQQVVNELLADINNPIKINTLQVMTSPCLELNKCTTKRYEK